MMVNKIASRLRFCSRGALAQSWGGAVRPREIFLNPAIFIWIIRTLFNRNKSGRCAPRSCNGPNSYESKLSTNWDHHNCRLTSADLFLPCAVLLTDAEVSEDVAEDFVS